RKKDPKCRVQESPVITTGYRRSVDSDASANKNRRNESQSLLRMIGAVFFQSRIEPSPKMILRNLETDCSHANKTNIIQVCAPVDSVALNCFTGPRGCAQGTNGIGQNGFCECRL